MGCIKIEMPANSIFPTTEALLAPVTALYQIPKFIRGDMIIPFPVTPTVASVKEQMAGIVEPTLESIQSAAGIQSGVIPAIINAVLEPISSLITLPPMPTLPGIPFQFTDILPPYDPSALYALLAEFDIPSIPNMPVLWPSVVSPVKSYLQAAQIVMNEITEGALMFLIDAINLFTKYIHDVLGQDFALPELPTIPTLEQMIGLMPTIERPTMAMLLAVIPPPFSLTLPNPLMPNISDPDHEFTYAWQSLKSEAVAYVLKICTDFVATLPLLPAITLPTWQDLLPIPLPITICHELIP